MSYTPGPWLRDGLTVYALMHAGWRAGVEIFKNRFSCSVHWAGAECDAEELEANANLMTAAPDLLEALKEMLVNGGCSTTEWMPLETIKKARAAIAKAEGRAA